MGWVSHAPSEQHRFNAPRPIHNHFANGFISDGAEVALSVTVAPDRSRLSLVETIGMYALPDFATKVQEYIARCTGDANSVNPILQRFSNVKVWYKFRVQQCSTSSTILPSQAVQALPPSPSFPLGHCDAVLLNTDGQSEHNPQCTILFVCCVKLTLIMDVDSVAQVRVIFQLTPPARSKDKLPDFLALPLLYIQPFDITATPDDQPHTRLWMLKRSFSEPRRPGSARAGLVIPLTEVTQPVDLVPIFGASVDRTVTAATSQEVYDEFFSQLLYRQGVFQCSLRAHGCGGRV
ncbi:hypothetical protein BU15DRAFT_55803 [Melanogaster broomeanus]|nr:hypothetical protein BU15DRAFT_55803 [Melanogaster broomeanus]